MYTVTLRPADPVPTFRPGQFLHLTVEAYDPAGFWPESRVFSIASSPRDRTQLRICYAVKGRYTARMEQQLSVGSEVWIKLPYGDFVVEGNTDVVLLAGGTGISAFTAFLEALEPAHASRVFLAYGARSPGLLLFSDMIFRQLERVPGFDALFFAEAGDPRAEASFPAAGAPGCLPGRLALDPVWAQVDQAAERTFYLSGPPLMLRALGEELRSRGVPPERIRVDAWE